MSFLIATSIDEAHRLINECLYVTPVRLCVRSTLNPKINPWSQSVVLFYISDPRWVTAAKKILVAKPA